MDIYEIEDHAHAAHPSLTTMCEGTVVVVNIPLAVDGISQRVTFALNTEAPCVQGLRGDYGDFRTVITDVFEECGCDRRKYDAQMNLGCENGHDSGQNNVVRCAACDCDKEILCGDEMVRFWTSSPRMGSFFTVNSANAHVECIRQDGWTAAEFEAVA